MRQRKFRQELLVVLGLLLIGSFFVRNEPVHATGLPFRVVPVVPANQRVTGEAYFDVLAAPGSQTTLTLRLENTSTKPVDVRVRQVSLQTSNSGQLDYEQKQQRDAHLVYDASTLLTGAKKVTLPAQQTTEYQTTLTMPSQPYDGVIAGGLVLSPIIAAPTTKKEQVSVINRYQYAIPVIARNERKTWAPQLTFGAAKVQQVTYHNQAQLQLNNPRPTFLNQLRVEMTAKNLTSGKNYQRSTAAMQMAPNSHFDYSIPLPQTLPAGTYRLHAVAYYVKDAAGPFVAADQQRYRYRETTTKQVVVTKQQARELTRQIKHAKTAAGNKLITWIIAGISALVLIIIGLTVYIIHLRHRGQKKQA